METLSDLMAVGARCEGMGEGQPLGIPAMASGPGAGAFPLIADYAFLSDCVTVALVAPSGDVEWMCLPRPDSPSVFGAILDRDAGTFRIGPADALVPAARRYLPGTMVLETTWMSRAGWLIVRDALLVGSWHHDQERSRTHRRVPTDHEADHVFARTVRCVQGSVELLVDCEPAFEYGQTPAVWEFEGETYGRAVATGPGLQLRLTTDLRLALEGSRARARTTLLAGDRAFAALTWAEERPPDSFDDAFERLERTSQFWRDWLARGRFPDHPWREYLQRSALTLKGLIYAPTGAMLAAATTSLPETPGGKRNWDYRYAWIRDSTFGLWGLYTLGFESEADDFFYFVADVAEGEAELQVMYAIDGERQLTEQVLDHLSGYDGARPVRIGNNAYEQVQHDVWGALLDSVYLHVRSREYLAQRVWPTLRRQVERAIERWREPDHGIWEVRGAPRHFTSSKLFCWVAADRGARLAAMRDEPDLAARWRAAANEIHADICAHALDERGVFVQDYDTTALDAALLLMPLVRFLPPSDPRIRNTVRAIADELTVGELVLRYRVDETDDGLATEEGTFTICSFWLVSALVEIGQLERARKLCEKLLSLSSPLQLFAEEIDPSTGRHLGNFPQAFTHLALINAVMHVIRGQQPETARPRPTAFPDVRGLL
jgi:GH15 family glucan-1,4-alpha-glucosidase